MSHVYRNRIAHATPKRKRKNDDDDSAAVQMKVISRKTRVDDDEDCIAFSTAEASTYNDNTTWKSVILKTDDTRLSEDQIMLLSDLHHSRLAKTSVQEYVADSLSLETASIFAVFVIIGLHDVEQDVILSLATMKDNIGVIVFMSHHDCDKNATIIAQGKRICDLIKDCWKEQYLHCPLFFNYEGEEIKNSPKSRAFHVLVKQSIIMNEAKLGRLVSNAEKWADELEHESTPYEATPLDIESGGFLSDVETPKKERHALGRIVERLMKLAKLPKHGNIVLDIGFGNGLLLQEIMVATSSCGLGLELKDKFASTIAMNISSNANAKINATEDEHDGAFDDESDSSSSAVTDDEYEDIQAMKAKLADIEKKNLILVNHAKAFSKSMRNELKHELNHDSIDGMRKKVKKFTNAIVEELKANVYDLTGSD